MDEIAKALVSPAWWVLTVLVSLMVNLATGWLQPWLTTRIRQRSEAGRARDVAEHNAMVDASARLAASHEALMEGLIEDLRLRAKATHALLLAIFAFLLYVWLEPSTTSNRAVYYVSFALLGVVFLFGAVYVVAVNVRVRESLKIEYAREIQQGIVKVHELKKAVPDRL